MNNQCKKCLAVNANVITSVCELRPHIGYSDNCHMGVVTTVTSDDKYNKKKGRI